MLTRVIDKTILHVPIFKPLCTYVLLLYLCTKGEQVRQVIYKGLANKNKVHCAGVSSEARQVDTVD